MKKQQFWAMEPTTFSIWNVWASQEDDTKEPEMWNIHDAIAPDIASRGTTAILGANDRETQLFSSRDEAMLALKGYLEKRIQFLQMVLSDLPRRHVGPLSDCELAYIEPLQQLSEHGPRHLQEWLAQQRPEVLRAYVKAYLDSDRDYTDRVLTDSQVLDKILVKTASDYYTPFSQMVSLGMPKLQQQWVEECRLILHRREEEMRTIRD